MQNYYSSDKSEAKKYDDVFSSIEMVQLIQKAKPNKKESASKLKKRLEEIQTQNSVAANILDQSQKYDVPDDTEERNESYAEAKKLRKIISDRESTYTPEKVNEILDAYKGKYSVRDIQETDKSRLQRLRTQAKVSLQDNSDTEQNTSENNESQNASTDNL